MQQRINDHCEDVTCLLINNVNGRYEVSVTGKSNHNETIPPVIAFHAFMSKDVHPGAGRRLVFDLTKTNQGKGYNGHTGVFTCPKTGMYVFVWVVRIYAGEHSTELMIHGSVHGSTFLRAKNGDDGSVSGTVVVHVSKGDRSMFGIVQHIPEMVKLAVT
ncbi:Hypothetical predicted protein [Mytilus galloprovincialis]|uniref:C1q domain-containing protein n=1 Tax=Mytilus galloprovincialis TaxID=29158 RepID=A0A8B6FQ11_MYTGA|nr:Hypothetical predicted protein [Mytilus galloprovincialis]